MTKQLITLIGVLVTVAVLAVAVMVGVVPLTAGVLGAYAQRQLVASTNAGYETQISALRQQEQRIGEIEDAVSALRAQIPAAEQLNEVFERIARSAESTGVRVVSVTRGDLLPYAPRTGTGEDPATVPAPASTETPTADGAAPDPNAPIDAAQDVADAANGGNGTAAPPAAAARGQVELSISINALDIVSAVAFIDGLRDGPRAVAVDTVVITGSPGSFDVQVTALAFIQSDGQADGGE